jgi:trk system potassium uptake protein TrkA
MSKQFVVIGLGSTGTFLAKHLTSLDHSVLAIDVDPEAVQDITPFVANALVADCTRAKALQGVPVTKADAVVVCIGSLEASLLTVLNLKDMGAARVIAKSVDEAHSAILEKMGVHEIFQPEREMAVLLAERLNRPNMIDYLPFMEGYSIVEWACPQELAGKKLMEANLINKYGVQVIAISDPLTQHMDVVPTVHYELIESDVLFLLGPNEALDKLK